jgi:hypothetical protein
MPYPKKIETVHIEKLDKELCIYDWQRMEVYNLNPTAAKVWELCDGQTSPAQMAEKLRAELNTPHAEELVWLTLARLEKAHLLQEVLVKPTGHKTLTRRELLKGLGVAAALLPVVSSIVAPGPVEAQSPQPPGATATPTNTPVPTGSQTFNFTGAEQQFTVPAGVTSVTIEVFGAEGGLGFASNLNGQGGRSVATIAVTAGETLFVYVGGRGGDVNNANPGVPGAGGFNGGGGGGASLFAGGGGGGASDVRQGSNGLANRVVVAGGGGGGGSPTNANPGGFGGDGGGTTGANGTDGSPSPAGTGGGGGTQSSGGVGGTGGGGNPGGTNGSSGSGGTGGGGGFPVTAGGGGGGGGYFGGGGGGSGFTATGNEGGSGGGGGGSSFAIPTATGVTLQQGGRTGNGQVIISW